MQSIESHAANHLIDERSPYLQQHAHNPVDWYPWSEDAFTRAKEEAKPIFLSIGYATCHWCHVMAHESFGDETTAAFLNEHFVSIKVDREELPDVDHIYMSAAQALSGHGGWPLTVFLTPELKPFFAGTYFPLQPAYGRPSFMQLLTRIAELWTTERASLLESGAKLEEFIAARTTIDRQASTSDIRAIRAQCFAYFDRAYDETYGGFGPAPKFPRPVQFEFLFDEALREKNNRASEIALGTLRAMCRGGMHDQLGGGFHRYSVDAQWLVPHFEKMLYDQAQLLSSYTTAFQLTDSEEFRTAALGICTYVLRDLLHPEGGFYSAEDADSEGREGSFYVWTKAEFERTLKQSALSDSEIEILTRYFGVSDAGNFERGENILHVAEAEQMTNATLITTAKEALLLERNRRERPLRDSKIQTSWNGLMIGALARASRAFGRQDLLDAAIRAGTFIERELRPDGKLKHRWIDGEARFDAYLESYAFIIQGLLELYTTTFDAAWLERAIELQSRQDATLWDTASAGYFMSEPRSDLLFQPKVEYDGAEPSGNSVALGNLNWLYAITGRVDYREKAAALSEFLLRRIASQSPTMPLFVRNAVNTNMPALHITFSGSRTEAIEMRRTIDTLFLGQMTVAYADHGTPIDEFYRSLASPEPNAYLCQHFTCEWPMTVKGLQIRMSEIALRSDG